MFAIIQSGGRQVKVTPGSVVTVDRVDDRAGRGSQHRPGAAAREGRRRGPGRRAVRRQRPGRRHRRRRVARPEDPRVQEEAPQGDAPDQGPPQHLHAHPREGDSRSNGSQKRSRQLPQRARQQLAAPRRQALRRQHRHRRVDPGAPARPPVPAGPQRRPRQGRHAVREGRRPGEVRGPRRARPRHQRAPARDRRSPKPARSSPDAVVASTGDADSGSTTTADASHVVVRRRSRHPRRGRPRRARRDELPAREVRAARRARTAATAATAARSTSSPAPTSTPCSTSASRRSSRPATARTAKAPTAPGETGHDVELEVPIGTVVYEQADDETVTAGRRPDRRRPARAHRQGRARRLGQRAVRHLDQPRAAQGRSPGCPAKRRTSAST